MATRKNKKSNKRFRKTRSKIQRGGTPENDLINGAIEGNLGDVQQALDAGADVNAKSWYNRTALTQASWNGHTEIVKLLLENGADVNAKNYDDYPALIRASQYGYTEIVAMLLEKGADVNAKTNDGYTALIWASNKGHIEIVALLTAAIEAEKKVKGHKQDAMKLVRHRDVKIPSLFNFAYGQLPTSEISIINEYELPRKKLGGKRKSNRKTKKSKRKTRKNS